MVYNLITWFILRTSSNVLKKQFAETNSLAISAPYREIRTAQAKPLLLSLSSNTT